MSRVSIDVGRLDLALHGVSAAVAEAAVEGLEGALRRRLGALPPDRRGAFEQADLALGALESGSALDAGALRGIIADRLVEAILAAGHGGTAGSAGAAGTGGAAGSGGES